MGLKKQPASTSDNVSDNSNQAGVLSGSKLAVPHANQSTQIFFINRRTQTSPRVSRSPLASTKPAQVQTSLKSSVESFALANTLAALDGASLFVQQSAQTEDAGVEKLLQSAAAFDFYISSDRVSSLPDYVKIISGLSAVDAGPTGNLYSISSQSSRFTQTVITCISDFQYALITNVVTPSSQRSMSPVKDNSRVSRSANIHSINHDIQNNVSLTQRNPSLSKSSSVDPLEGASTQPFIFSSPSVSSSTTTFGIDYSTQTSFTTQEVGQSYPNYEIIMPTNQVSVHVPVTQYENFSSTTHAGMNNYVDDTQSFTIRKAMFSLSNTFSRSDQVTQTAFSNPDLQQAQSLTTVDSFSFTDPAYQDYIQLRSSFSSFRSNPSLSVQSNILLQVDRSAQTSFMDSGSLMLPSTPVSSRPLDSSDLVVSSRDQAYSQAALSTQTSSTSTVHPVPEVRVVIAPSFVPSKDPQAPASKNLSQIVSQHMQASSTSLASDTYLIRLRSIHTTPVPGNRGVSSDLTHPEPQNLSEKVPEARSPTARSVHSVETETRSPVLRNTGYNSLPSGECGPGKTCSVSRHTQTTPTDSVSLPPVPHDSLPLKLNLNYEKPPEIAEAGKTPGSSRSIIIPARPGGLEKRPYNRDVRRETVPDSYVINRRPAFVMCYICGREYGTASIGIHEKHCLARWRKENDERPPKLRQSEPVKPQVNIEAARVNNEIESENFDLDAINEAAKEAFQAQFVPCETCYRTFFPDSLLIHRRSCTGRKEIKPSVLAQKYSKKNLDI